VRRDRRRLCSPRPDDQDGGLIGIGEAALEKFEADGQVPGTSDEGLNPSASARCTGSSRRTMAHAS
jgi:hypothetical protein